MATCPHGCSRCRAIEAGLGGQPLGPTDFARIGEIVEPEPWQIAYSDETLEAADLVEAAQIGFDQAARETEALYLKLHAAKNGTREPLTAALKVAGEDREQAARHLSRARARHHELAKRDEEQQRRAEFDAMQLQLEAQRTADDQRRRRAIGERLRKAAKH